MGDNMTAASAVMMYPGDYDGPLLEGVFQPMPELTGDEYEALKADVKARGIITPVMVDQHGRVLDGHHRLKVARELGIVCPLIVHPVADDAEAWGLALAVNAARRQLNREQRRELIRRELVRCPGDSDRAIARRVGCSHRTVAVVRNPEQVDKLPIWERPGDVDPVLRERILNQYDAMRLPGELPGTDAEAERFHTVMLHDADETLAFRLALAAGVDQVRLAVAVVTRMALWKSRGVDRATIRRLFEPWVDMALSPSVHEEHRANEALLGMIPTGDDDRAEALENYLRQVASVPELKTGGERMTRAEAEASTAKARAAARAVQEALMGAAAGLLSNGVAVPRIVAALETRRANLDHETPAEIGQVAGLLIDPVIAWVQAPETLEEWRPDFEGPEFLPMTEGETQEALELLAGGAL